MVSGATEPEERPEAQPKLTGADALGVAGLLRPASRGIARAGGGREADGRDVI